MTSQVALLSSEPALGYVVALRRLFLERDTPAPKWLKPGLLDRAVLAFEPSTLLARRSMFDEVGLFDPSYAMGSDVDWFFRVKDRGISWAVVQEVLVHRRTHSANSSHSTGTLAADLRRTVFSSIRRQRHGESADGPGRADV